MESILARNLKFLRKINNLNLVDLAAIFQIGKSSLSDYENAKSVPSFMLVEKYCKKFGVSISAIGYQIFEKNAYRAGLYQEAGIRLHEVKEFEQRYALLNQKLSGLEVQLSLLNQLLESKDSENKTLKLQIELLRQLSGSA